MISLFRGIAHYDRAIDNDRWRRRKHSYLCQHKLDPLAGPHVNATGLEALSELCAARVGEDGEYAADTIMPGHYPTRPAQHIHYFVHATGYKPLITQAYFATDPWFEGDPDKTFGRIAKNRELVRPVTFHEQRETPLKGRLEMNAGEAYAAITFDVRLEKA